MSLVGTRHKVVMSKAHVYGNAMIRLEMQTKSTHTPA